ncbi:permease [Thermodesulfobacteriota bacterium]
MKVTVIIMFLLASSLTILAYMRDPGYPLEGLKNGGKLFVEILPAMIFAFIAAGMIVKVLPRELLTRWIGDESGLRGIIVASLAGAVTPGGPYIQFPVVVALLKSGAGIGPLGAFISSWALLGVNRLFVWEIPLLGWKLSICRYIASMAFPILIGLLTRFLWLKVP